MRWIWLLVALGCCPDSGELEVVGPRPEHTVAVLELARQRCDMPWSGRIRFTDDSCDGLAGFCWWEGCSMKVCVSTLEPGRWAQGTALAHEIGHYCLQTDSEVAADRWAQKINDEVNRRLKT